MSGPHRAYIEPRLLLRVTTVAASDGRFGIGFLFVAVNLVAFNATGFVLPASRDAVISVLHVNIAAFARRVRVIGLFVAGNALQHQFLARVFVSVMAILASLGIRRLRVVSMVEVFDDAPSGVLAPMRTLLRVA